MPSTTPQQPHQARLIGRAGRTCVAARKKCPEQLLAIAPDGENAGWQAQQNHKRST
jgi:hypothetical protein